MKYENGKETFENSGFKILPKLEDNCTPDSFDFSGCKLDIYDTS